jgi:hypothetical protein
VEAGRQLIAREAETTEQPHTSPARRVSRCDVPPLVQGCCNAADG